MRKQFPAFYRPTPDELAKKFNECVFAFDTNVLLNLYRYTPKSREDVLATLRSMRERIWLPHWAAHEYQTRRLKVWIDEIKLGDKIKSVIGEAIQKVQALGKRSVQFALTQLIEPVEQELEEIMEGVEKKKEKMPDLLHGDKVFDALTELFDGRVGESYSCERLEEIHKQGKARYEKEIPPGFKDRSKSR